MSDDYLPGEKPTPQKKRQEKAKFSDLSPVDRLPPHSDDAEMGVLGCCMLDPNVCIGECVERFPDGVEVFYDQRNQVIYKVLVEMYEARQPIDTVSLRQALKDRKLQKDCGGIEYVIGLPDCVPSAANLAYYADVLQEKYVLRRLVHTCTEIAGRIYEWEGDVPTLLDQAERDILAIGQAGLKKKTYEAMKGPIVRAISRIEDYQARQGQLTGTTYGFADLDSMTGGMHDAEMIVIAARPSMGKTSLAMNIAEVVAADCKEPVGVFSLEMSIDALTERMLCSRARVNLRNVKQGYMAERDYPKITHAAGTLSAAPIYIDDEGGLSISKLRAKARRMHQALGIKLFVIDYLQLLHALKGGRPIINRQEEVATISGGIKEMAKELNVPVIVLSQLNRDLDKYKGRKPTLSDLRESGAIEQDADLVGMLYKPKSGNDDEEEEETDSVLINLNIAKQRNGPTGDVKLVFLKPYTRFESVAKVGDSDVPSGDAQPTMI